MIHDNHDTIAALATAVGEGALGVIRISGQRAKEILSQIFFGPTPVQEFQTHRMYLGNIQRVGTPTGPQIIDQVMAVWMKEGKSFTGEEVVEIHGHGSPLVLNQILALIVNKGARLAEPGEFSKRAYLNNKIDLAQAEAIADLIHSQSEYAATNALSQLSGYFSNLIATLRHQLIDLLAKLELGFDFAEEDVHLAPKKEVCTCLEKISQEVTNLLDSFQTGQIYKKGIKVALIGRPNAGKSSLLNAILKEEKAIVHHEPGTTRDVVIGERKVQGLVLHFYDTAGIRASSDSAVGHVEKVGIERSREMAEKADFVGIVIDSSTPMTEEDKNLSEILNRKKGALIFNKMDLLSEKASPADMIFQNGFSLENGTSVTCFSVSAKENKGIGELLDKIVFSLIDGQKLQDKNFVLNNVRHRHILLNVQDELTEILSKVNADQLPEEFLAEDLRHVVKLLGSIVGAIDSEVVLDEIFSNFCIGK